MIVLNPSRKCIKQCGCFIFLIVFGCLVCLIVCLLICLLYIFLFIIKSDLDVIFAISPNPCGNFMNAIKMFHCFWLCLVFLFVILLRKLFVCSSNPFITTTNKGIQFGVNNVICFLFRCFGINLFCVKIRWMVWRYDELLNVIMAPFIYSLYICVWQCGWLKFRGAYCWYVSQNITTKYHTVLKIRWA